MFPLMILFSGDQEWTLEKIFNSWIIEAKFFYFKIKIMDNSNLILFDLPLFSTVVLIW